MRTYLAIFASLIIVAVISCLFGFAGLILGINFWITFFVASAFQMIVGASWNSYIDIKTRLQRESILASNRLANSLQMAELTCAYCGTKNIVDIAISRENTFVCTGCNNTNKVHISFSTVRITEPIIKDKVLGEIFSKLQSAPEVKNVDAINDSKIEISGGKNE